MALLTRCGVTPLVAYPRGLLPWWVALERRQFVSAIHPSDPFSDLNVRPRRNGVRIIIGCALNIYDPRQNFCISIEQSGATIGAEMSPAMFRGRVDLGRSPRHFDCDLRVHRPADHRRTGVPPAIRAMTERVGERVALSLIADCAAMAAAANHRQLSSLAPSVIGPRLSLDATLVGSSTIEELRRSHDPCSCSAVRPSLARSRL